MFTLRQTTVVLAFACLCCHSEAQLAGYWTGRIQSGSASTPFAVQIESDAATISFPNSGVMDAAVTKLELAHDRVSFNLRWLRENFAFEGSLNTGALAGTVSFDGKRMPFTLERGVWEPPYREEELKYTNGNVTIASTLFIPAGPGPHPAVVMLHGSGNNERTRYRFLADFFARQGVACLISDKRGCGESTGDWNEVGFVPLAEDGIAGVNLLQARADIDPKRVGMTGISQAGWVMVQAAALSDDIAFLMVDSSSTYDVEREGFYDFEAQLAAAGHGKDVIEKAVAILRLDNHVTRTGQGHDELMASVNQARQEPWFKDMGFMAMPVSAGFRKFYALILDFDPKPLIEKIKLPILWLYGEKDMSVSSQESIAILEDIDKRLDKDYTSKLFPGADHGLRVPPDPARDAFPAPVLAEGYLDAKAAFIRERVLANQLGS